MSKRASSEFLLLLHSQDRFALTFLELTTSTSDDKSSFSGEIVSHRKVLTGSHSIFLLHIYQSMLKFD